MGNNWPKVKLGEVLKHRKEFITIDDMTLYRRPRVQLHAQGIVIRNEILGTFIRTKKQQVCHAGEFLVAEIDAKVGGYGLVPDSLDSSIVSSHYFLFVLDESRLDRKFLDYFIRTPAFGDQVAAQGSTNYAAICPSQVLSYEIPLPLLTEQRRIVGRIEEFTAKIERAQKIRKQAAEEAEALWESSLSATFDKVARSAPRKRFRDICEVIRGGSPRPRRAIFYEGTIPFLKVADLTKDDEKYLNSYTAKIKEAGLSSKRRVGANTLMLTNSGSTLGVPKICTFSTSFNDGIQAFLNLPDCISKEYLYYFLRSKTRWFRNWAARGQSQPNLNTEMVKEMELPLPSLDEQTEIVDNLDHLKKEMERVKNTQIECTSELDALMPSILDQAFRGELSRSFYADAT
jgi:type I restriction enzyme S subunit